jgi:hypothetical protein
MSFSETTSLRPLSFFISPGRFLAVTWPPESLFSDKNCNEYTVVAMGVDENRTQRIS